MMLDLTRTRDGLAYLHLWREGEEYLRQKGERFLPEWTNVMFVATPKRKTEGVHYLDLSKGSLAFSDDTFDAANACHVLEHLTPEEGEALVAEVFRILRPGSVFRVSVPDLETICRGYLSQLTEVRENPTIQCVRRYRWNVMEIFEQAVREETGGMMLDALRRGEYDRDYLDQVYSDVYHPFFEKEKEKEKEREPAATEPRQGEARMSLSPRAIYRTLRKHYRRHRNWGRQHPSVTKERTRWMYDRVSLSLLMRRIGFARVQEKDFKASDIPHWDRYDLDRSNFSDRAIDPSVYVEGMKPTLAGSSSG